MQKELLLTLTELAKASIEVPLGLMPHDGTAWVSHRPWIFLADYQSSFAAYRLTRSCSRHARVAVGCFRGTDICAYPSKGVA